MYYITIFIYTIQINKNNFNYYLFKEVMIDNKYYIFDKNENIIINKNGHDY